MSEIEKLQKLAGLNMNENDVFKTSGMQRAQSRDDAVSKGKQFGVGNFYAWLMSKYPKLTLGQVQQKMPSLEREYAQEKSMRKNEPDMVPSVNSAFDDKGEEMKAKGLESIQRIKELAGLPLNEEEVEKVAVGHVDDEKGMLANDLYLIGKNAVEIHKMLKGLPSDSDFPHWWQSKVVKSKEYIEGAKNYLESELTMPDAASVSPEITDDRDPSGVS